MTELVFKDNAPFRGILQVILDKIGANDFHEMGHIESSLRMLAQSLTSEMKVILSQQIDSKIIECVDYAGTIPKQQFRNGLHGFLNNNDIPQFKKWVQSLALCLCNLTFPELKGLVLDTPDFGLQLFKFLVHEILLNKNLNDIQSIENIFNYYIDTDNETYDEVKSLIVNSVVYLRSYNLTQDKVDGKTNQLLLSYRQLAEAAHKVNMNKSSLMFLELDWSIYGRNSNHDEILTQICRKLDDPDIFYGIPIVPTLSRAIENQQLSGSSNIWNKISYETAMFDNSLLLRQRDISSTLAQSLTWALMECQRSCLSH